MVAQTLVSVRLIRKKTIIKLNVETVDTPKESKTFNPNNLMTQSTQIVIPHSAPETQKVHIRHAQIEINTGIKNLRDAIGSLAQNENFRYSKEDKAEMREFLATAICQLEGLHKYFGLKN